MLKLGNMPPKPEHGHLLVMVLRPSPVGDNWTRGHYLCLRCLRMARKYGEFLGSACYPGRGCSCTRGYLNARSETIPPELADLIAEEGLKNGRNPGAGR